MATLCAKQWYILDVAIHSVATLCAKLRYILDVAIHSVATPCAKLRYILDVAIHSVATLCAKQWYILSVAIQRMTYYSESLRNTAHLTPLISVCYVYAIDEFFAPCVSPNVLAEYVECVVDRVRQACIPR